MTTYSHGRGTQTAVPCHTDSIAAQLKGSAEVGLVAWVSWSCMCGDVACKTPCSHRRSAQNAVPCHTDLITAQLIGLAEVGRVACVSKPCACGDVACMTLYSHRSGTRTVVPCHTHSAGDELRETCACSSARSSRSGTSSASRAILGNLLNNSVQF